MRSTLLLAVVLFFAAGVLAFAQEGRSSAPPRLPLGKPPSRPTAAASMDPYFARTDAEPVSVASTKDATKHKRVVCRLRAVPAAEAARLLEQVFRAERTALPGQPSKPAAIVADSLTNSLIVSGAPEAVEEVQQLIEKLDQPAAMIRFDIVIAETQLVPPGTATSAGSSATKKEANRLTATKPGAHSFRVVPKPEQMEVLVRSELTTLDNQPAFLKMKRREPRMTGTSFSHMTTTNSITYEEVGVTVGLTPRVGSDKAVTVSLDVDDSRLGPTEEGVPLVVNENGARARSPSTEGLMSQCTVRIADGETIAVAGMADRPKSGKQRLILVTAHVLPIGAAGR